MILHLCSTYIPWVAASPWYTDTQTVRGTTMGSEHIHQGIRCTLQPFRLPSASSSPCLAKPLTQPSHIPWLSHTLLYAFHICKPSFPSLCKAASDSSRLLNPSLKLVFLQWSNFFTHRINVGYKRSGYFSKNCDIFLKPIFSSLSVQKLNSPQHSGRSCDSCHKLDTTMVSRDSETHTQLREG